MASAKSGGGIRALSWKVNRLRAMGAGEVLHRGAQSLQQRGEKARIQAGWSPKPPVPVKTKMLLFDDADGASEIGVADLELLIARKVDVFGHEPMAFADWSTDPVTGIRAPLEYGKQLDYRDESKVGNVKILWEFARQQHLVSLAAAFAMSGSEKYHLAIRSQIESFLQEAPYGLGIHWCSSLEASLRLISWNIVHSLVSLRHAPGLLDIEGFGESVYQHLFFIDSHYSRFSSANNHLIGELAGVFTSCSVFDFGQTGEVWQRAAFDELEAEAAKQVYADGVDKEQALYYHLWVLEYLLFTCLVGRRAGQQFSQPYEETILKMAQFLVDVTPQGGTPPQIGDSDDGFVARFEPRWPKEPYRDVLSAVDAVFCGGDTNATAKSFWYSKIATAQPKGRLEKSGSTSYPFGGYAIFANERLHAVLDAGALGYPSIAAHGHADALNIVLALDGRWWLVDPGTYAYHDKPEWRDYFRGTSAHNTVRVDEMDQSRSGGPFLWISHADAKLVAASPNAAEGRVRNNGIEHERKIQLANQTLEIIDRLQGAGKHKLEWYFHLHPHVSILPNDVGFTLARAGSETNLDVSFAGASVCWDTVVGNESPILGWYSEKMGQKTPCAVLRGVYHGPLPVELRSIWKLTQK